MPIARMTLAVGIMAGAYGSMVWLLLNTPRLSQPWAAAVELLFLAVPLGAMWAFYDSARHCSSPRQHVMCAFVPYFFVWHLFQHVLGRRAKREQVHSRRERTRQSSESRPTDEPPQSSRPSASLTWVRRLLWAMALLSGAAVALTVVVGPWWPYTKVQMALVLMFFAVHPFGSLWMVYYSFRYEARPLPFVFLAFIPYSFLWYYFERVRGKQWVLHP